MKRSLMRAVILLITMAMLLSLVPVVAIAKDPVVVLSTSTTSIVLADAYEKIIPVGDTIYLETTLGPAYFDCVRKGDKLTLRINVEKSGTYQWGMVTGWAENYINGTFTLLIDGKQAGKIINKVSGAGWRT